MNTEFRLRSGSLQEGQTVPSHFIFNGMGCTGDNLSPQLEWEGAPEGTSSYVLTMYDPDAPTDHGWWHWTVVNIPPNVTRLEEGASNENRLPAEAIELMADFERPGYGGPCPPRGHGTHRYVFTIYAMKEDKLDVDPKSTAEELKERLENESLAKASFTVKYGRPQ